jgi:uncharacterized protein (TIGR02284 family)
MPAKEDSKIKALNDLIATCRDAEEGYAKAAKGVHDTALSNRLVDISSERSRFAMELGAQVSQEGGKPATDAHYGGILHRGWIDLEARIRPKAEIEILRECLRGDETTLKHYAHALDQDLSPEERALVEHQRKAIETDRAALEELIGH